MPPDSHTIAMITTQFIDLAQGFLWSWSQFQNAKKIPFSRRGICKTAMFSLAVMNWCWPFSWRDLMPCAPAWTRCLNGCHWRFLCHRCCWGISARGCLSEPPCLGFGWLCRCLTSRRWALACDRSQANREAKGVSVKRDPVDSLRVCWWCDRGQPVAHPLESGWRDVDGAQMALFLRRSCVWVVSFLLLNRTHRLAPGRAL